MNAKISVIIPMYNAEKYIRECLISVLASKFTDYEVLVVDDCSTDNSLAEVKKIMPHFDGRLKIFSTEKNFCAPGLPRNVGIKNAAGKYIVFVDADDMILPDALGIFFDAAEIYKADVVHAEKWFAFNRTFDGKNLKQIHLKSDGDEIKVADLRERMRRFINENFAYGPCGKIFSRELLIKHEIFFQKMRYAEDKIFNFKCAALAERYVFIPHALNIYRVGTSSTSRVSMGLNELVRTWLGILLECLGDIAEFMSRLEFFRADPVLRREIFKSWIEYDYTLTRNISETVAAHDLQKALFNELQNPELNPTGKNIFTAYLCTEKFLAR